MLDSSLYPSEELKPDCRVIPLALKATVETGSEKLNVNVASSIFKSKFSNSGGVLSIANI